MLELITVHLGEQIIKAQWPVWTVKTDGRSTAGPTHHKEFALF